MMHRLRSAAYLAALLSSSALAVPPATTPPTIISGGNGIQVVPNTTTGGSTIRAAVPRWVSHSVAMNSDPPAPTNGSGFVGYVTVSGGVATGTPLIISGGNEYVSPTVTLQSAGCTTTSVFGNTVVNKGITVVTITSGGACPTNGTFALTAIGSAQSGYSATDNSEQTFYEDMTGSVGFSRPFLVDVNYYAAASGTNTIAGDYTPNAAITVQQNFYYYTGTYVQQSVGGTNQSAGTTTLAMASVANINIGNVITGSASLPTNVTVLGIVPGTNQITISAQTTASINAGTLLTFTPQAGIPVSYNGASVATLSPGSLIKSTNISVAVPPNTAYGINTLVTAAGVNGKYEWPKGPTIKRSYSIGGSVIAETAAHGTNLSWSPFPPAAGGFNAHYTALGVVAYTTQMAALLMGDSLDWGILDNNGQGNFQDVGFLARAINTTAGYLNLARSSDHAQFDLAYGTLRNQLDPSWFTHVVSGYGSNDINANNFSTVIGYMRLVWAAERLAGHKVIAATFLPRSTSTDNWTTVNNQTGYPGWAPASGASVTGTVTGGVLSSLTVGSGGLGYNNTSTLNFPFCTVQPVVNLNINANGTIQSTGNTIVSGGTCTNGSGQAVTVNGGQTVVQQLNQAIRNLDGGNLDCYVDPALAVQTSQTPLDGPAWPVGTIGGQLWQLILSTSAGDGTHPYDSGNYLWSDQTVGHYNGNAYVANAIAPALKACLSV